MRVVVAVRRMVGREHLDGPVGEAAPQRLLIGRLARRRAEDQPGSLEPRQVEVGGGEPQVLRAGLRVHIDAAVPGPADLVERVCRGHVHDEQGRPRQLGQGDGPVGRLALGQSRPRAGMVLRRSEARTQQPIGLPGDHRAVLGVDHHRQAQPGRQVQHLEHLPVVQREGVVGHVDLERRDAACGQRRQLLGQHLGPRVRDDQMEAIVHQRATTRPGVVLAHHRARRHPAVLCGERDEGGRSTAGRRNARGVEVVRRGEPARGSLIDVAMDVHAAGQQQHRRGVDFALAPVQRQAQCGDAPVLDSHVTRDHVGRGHHGGAANHEVELAVHRLGPALAGGNG